MRRDIKSGLYWVKASVFTRWEIVEYDDVTELFFLPGDPYPRQLEDFERIDRRSVKRDYSLRIFVAVMELIFSVAVLCLCLKK